VRPQHDRSRHDDGRRREAQSSTYHAATITPSGPARRSPRERQTGHNTGRAPHHQAGTPTAARACAEKQQPKRSRPTRARANRQSCGSAFRSIADPQGRLDDTFTYPGGVSVHPHVFRSALTQHPQIVEYQVRQTTLGADIDIVAERVIDTARLTRELVSALGTLGLDKPAVTITRVPAIQRQTTGKLKLFVALPG
jgi:hypothetical protein